jgi:flagellar motor switch protein FliM
MPRDGAIAADAAPYDFRRPNKFNRDHQRALQIAAETFARNFSTTLSTMLRATSHVQVRTVAQVTYDEFIREIPNPSYLALLALTPLNGASMFYLPLRLVMSAIDRLLGGNGTGLLPERPLTDIEDRLARNLMGRVLHELAYGFESLTAIQPQLLQQESNPQFAQLASATDMVVTISFEIRIGSESGLSILCIPLASLQPVLDDVTASALDKARVFADSDAVTEAVADLVRDAPVEISVRLADIRLSSSEIVDLRPGDVLSFNHAIDRPLAVTVGGVPRFAAIAGRRGKRLACVLVDDSTPARRIPS